MTLSVTTTTPRKALGRDPRRDQRGPPLRQLCGGEERGFCQMAHRRERLHVGLPEIIDLARKAIFIQHWWLAPELYLRRPPAYHPEWRLDRLLKQAQGRGEGLRLVPGLRCQVGE
ncbi:hypothetical protein B0H16DRAFT_583810 [Mycena metata]|uniref:Uncharacterized protein n=1 Tax=Mycena metata TaxID=1033252 RepID=A0AAD7H4Z3_9AGAR|nr:hypothetical protein B0H16DRAFT_583810 [Mycena metata]